MVTRDTHRRQEEIAKAPAAMVGEELMTFSVTLAGDPEVVTFGAQGLPDMEDELYRVAIHGEGAGKLDESTKAAGGFDIIGGAPGDVCHCFIHGKVAGRLR